MRQVGRRSDRAPGPAWIAAIATAIAVAIGCSAAVPATDLPGAVETATGTASVAPVATPTPGATMPVSPPPEPSVEPLPPDLDPALADAIRLRRSYGMRYDLAYVRMVAEDPRATNWEYAVPVYPEEFEDTQRRYEESRAATPIVQSYAGLHADEFGGLYIDEGTHAGVVSLWTDDLAVHAAAIRDLAAPGTRLAFGQVRYPHAELRRLQDVVTAEWDADWVAAIPARFQGVGVSLRHNAVVVEVSSANPDAEATIAAHFDAGDRVIVESDGTGWVFIPWSAVKGRVEPVRAAAGRDLNLEWTTDGLGTCGGGDMGFGISDDGTFDLPCQVGTWTIIVKESSGDGWVEIGRGTVEVREGVDARLTIQIDAP